MFGLFNSITPHIGNKPQVSPYAPPNNSNNNNTNPFGSLMIPDWYKKNNQMNSSTWQNVNPFINDNSIGNMHQTITTPFSRNYDMNKYGSMTSTPSDPATADLWKRLGIYT